MDLVFTIDIIAINIQQHHNAEEVQNLEVLIFKTYLALVTLQESWILLLGWVKSVLVFTIDIMLTKTQDLQEIQVPDHLQDQVFLDKMLLEEAQIISFDSSIHNLLSIK